MIAPQQPDKGTSNSDIAFKGNVKRPEVRPDVSFWDIREVKGSRWGKAAQNVVRNGLLPLGAIAVASLAIRGLLQCEGMDNGAKVGGVIAVVQSLVILGMATLLTGKQNHAATTPDNGDQPANSGDGGAGS